MQDIKLENLELFYDVLDESINVLYEVYHKPYFDLFEMTTKNIMASEILNDFENKDDYDRLQAIYDKLEGIDFSVEDVRKAIQSIVLRGFKELRMPNGNTTPDTLGILFAYLITRITSSKKLSILDPLCGTGNLLFSVSNHLDKELELAACDNDLLMTKITSLTADLLHTEVSVFLQDTLNLSFNELDGIVFDLPHSELDENKEYFPYKAFLHYKDMIKEDGFILAIVENDFFDYDRKQAFKKELLEELSILGLIELPDEMFKASKPKLILVLQKRKLEDKHCFMVKLPSFTDVKDFNTALLEIEQWFNRNNYNNK